MREACAETLTPTDMPDSIAASATPTEISAECRSYSTVQQLVRYVKKFSVRADTLTAAQVYPHSQHAHCNG